MGSSTVVVYPHLLLANTPLYKRREELGLIVEKVEDGFSEAEIVTQTASVSRTDFNQGMLYFYSAFLLHNMRASRFLAAYLDRQGIVSYQEFFLDFVEFWGKAKDCPVVGFIQDSIATMDFYDVFNYGKLIHYSLHEHRPAFDRLLHDFISSRPYYSDETVRFFSEVDRVLRPFVYCDTPVTPGSEAFEFLQVTRSATRAFNLRVPARFNDLFVKAVAPLESKPESDGLYSVDHAQFQYPYMKSRGLEHNAGYCYGMMIRVDSMVPKCVSLHVEAARV
jgi:hypothetical protein